MLDGLGYKILQKKVSATLVEANESPNASVRDAAKKVKAAMDLHVSTTNSLLSKYKTNPIGLLANSHEYLNFTGHTIVSWIWLRQGVIAANKLASNETVSPRDQAFYNGKIFTMRYFCDHELIKTTAQADLLKNNPQTNIEMKDDYF